MNTGSILKTLLFFALAWHLGAAPAPAAGPPKEPMLRIETGLHTAMVKAISCDASGRWLVTASEDKTVRIWDLAGAQSGAGKDLGTPRILRPSIGAGNEGKLFAAAISPDGSTIACGGWTGWDWQKSASVYFFDRASGRLLKRLDGFPNVIKALRFSRDGKRVAVALGAGQGVYLVRVSDWKLAGVAKGYGNDCYGLDFDRQGRLVTASWDGLVRLYDQAFRLITSVKAPNGDRPYSVAFTPDGNKIAVGCDDSRKVTVLSGLDLTPLYTAPGGADNGTLFSVTWSPDGAFLYAAGSYRDKSKFLVRRWEKGGMGAYRDLPVADGNVMQLATLPSGALAYAAAGPEIGVTGAGAAANISAGPGIPEHRDSKLLVSGDGTAVSFGYRPGGESRAVFAVAERSLRPGAPETGLSAPITEAAELPVTDWLNSLTPQLNGKPITLDRYETARSLALAPDRASFLMGTDWNLRCFDKQGKERWRSAAPGIVWQVNISASGKVAVAAFGDGSIRWYRLSDGVELLALFPHADRKRWVLWTPSGYYDASVGGEELAGWHLNNASLAADFFPVSRFRSVFCRPDVINRLLASWDEGEAVKGADAVAGKAGTKSLLSLLPPVVTITSPADKSSVESGEVGVDFTVRSPSREPVSGVRVLVNGRPVPFKEKSGGSPEHRSVLFSIPAGENEVAIIAENKHAASEPALLKLSRTGGEAETEVISMQPRLFILAVGVGAYPDKEMALDFAAKDARDFVALMQLQKGGLYGEVGVKLLMDAEAGRGAVLDGLKWLEGRAGERDTAIVFLSGHGVTEPGGGYYFLPADGHTDKLAASAVPFSEIRNALMSLPGKAVLFVDTCHAGEVMGGKKGDVNAVVNELSSTENGVVVFASSTGRQYSVEEPAWGNGAFTKALVEGLAGKADYTGKGRITVASLDLWLSERVQELTGGKQTPTTAKPRTIADFPLALKK